MLITFSGLDGSGKSTQAELIQTSLLSQGYQTTLLHLTHWTWVNRIGGAFFKQEEGPRALSPTKVTNTKWRLPRLLIMVLDIMRFWLLWLNIKARGQILICDRYFYDLGVQAIYTQVMSFSLATLYWRFIPQPTLAFWLQIEPEVAQQREDEHETSYYQTKSALYQQAVTRYPGIEIVSAASIVETEALVQSRVRQQIARVSSR